MFYRSIADMNDAIVQNLHRLPKDIDLVVGIPRSGILAANLFCLVTNIPMTDLDSFIDGRIYSSGISTKRRNALDRDLSSIRRILVLDDSILSGKAMRLARDRLEAAGLCDKVMLGAIFGSQGNHEEADFIFEVVPHPRVFQWNLMHHIILKSSFVEIDGVLCVEPIQAGNDEPAYRKSLTEAVPLHAPTRWIRTLVTSRSEEYRTETEDWLAHHAIEYGELIMRGPPGADWHGIAKGEIYGRSDARLYIGNDPAQAETIARISGKPALCIETQQMFNANSLSAAALRQQARNLPARIRQRGQAGGSGFKAAARMVLGEGGYNRLKSIIRPRNL
jgi:uncharacterized HAD superfamily protein/adenine/guanine phosphoribosyltransferase-like PRPP-binding protein